MHRERKSNLTGGGDVQLGRVVGVFGVRGEVRLHLYHRDGTFLFEEDREVSLLLPDGERRQVVVRARPGAGRRVIGMVEGIGGPEEAEALVGAEMMVPRSALPAPPEGAWYLHDLLEAEVVTESGRRLGRLVEIHQSGDVDVWEVAGEHSAYYFPALKDNIVSVEPGEVVVKEAGVIDAPPAPGARGG